MSTCNLWYLVTTLSSLLCICNSQFMNSSTTNIPTSTTPDSSNEEVYQTALVTAMILFGFIGLLLIPTMAIHAMYHLYKDDISSNVTRGLYITFFCAGTLTCLSLALFRTDLIIPMGPEYLSCKFGFYMMTQGIYWSKSTLFLIFLLRIDMAFHSSALGYKRSLLITIFVAYLIVITFTNIAHTYLSFPYVQLRSVPDTHKLGITDLSMCSTGVVSDNKTYSLVLAVMFMGDMLFSILVCCLFVYKLRVVIQMTKGSSSKKKNGGVSPSKDDHDRDRKLGKVIRKQTILVALAVLTSMATIGFGAFSTGALLFMSVDSVINTFCIWLMFTFSDAIWNKILHVICFCCFCCECCMEKKEGMLMTMHSMGRKLSTIRQSALTQMHSHSSRSSHVATRTSSTSSRTSFHESFASPMSVSSRERGKSDLPVITEEDIEIRFDNDIKPHDLPNKRNSASVRNSVNKKRTTIKTVITTTISTTIVEEETIASDDDDGNEGNDETTDCKIIVSNLTKIDDDIEIKYDDDMTQTEQIKKMSLVMAQPKRKSNVTPVADNSDDDPVDRYDSLSTAL